MWHNPKGTGLLDVTSPIQTIKRTGEPGVPGAPASPFAPWSPYVKIYLI